MKTLSKASGNRPWLKQYTHGIKASLKYPSQTLPEMFDEAAQDAPARPALIYFGSEISYKQLSQHVHRCAAGLQKLGVRYGDRVALMLSNCPQFPIAYFGALKAGAIVTATSPMYTPREAAYQWKDCLAETIIVERKLLKVVRAVLPELPHIKRVIVTGNRDYYPANLKSLEKKLKTALSPKTIAGKFIPWESFMRLGSRPQSTPQKPADVACLQYTGGTTGASKGAMLTHQNMVRNVRQACHWIQNDNGKAERTVAALPMYHIYAMTCIMISGIYMRGTVIILPRFQLKAALNVVKKYQPSMYHGVPTMYVAFNTAPNVHRYGFNSLRLCLSGGAPLPVEVQEKFQKLTGGKLVEAYGLTEASPVTHINPPDGVVKNGSIGVPITDTDARIVDLKEGTNELPVGEIGELIIRGPQIMKGYWNKPEETARVLRDGWLYTGDIARMDEEGYFYICDRKKDLILVGGFNVYTREVEDVLFEHPQVAEAMVIGVPDTYRGENVKAYLVPKPGARPKEEEIIAFCRERLAPYKIPRLVEFRESLPKSGVGKYLRRALRDEVKQTA